MSIESVMPSSHLILCCPLLLLPSIFPSIKVFSNESALCIKWQSIGVSASTSVLPMNIQGLFPVGWTGLTSLPVQHLLWTPGPGELQKWTPIAWVLALWSGGLPRGSSEDLPTAASSSPGGTSHWPWSSGCGWLLLLSESARLCWGIFPMRGRAKKTHVDGPGLLLNCWLCRIQQ